METEKNVDGLSLRDRELWRIAKKRVGFKRHLGTYIIINTMLWLLWLFTDNIHEGSLPWPVWPMMGWGIGLAFNYLEAYVYTKGDAIEKEFNKMKNR